MKVTGKSYKLKSAHYFLRHLLVIGAFGFMAVIGASAQPADGTHFYLQGGASLSTIQNAAGSGLNKLNFFAGAGYQTPIADAFTMHLELNVLEKGTRQPASTSAGNPSGIDQYRSSLLYVQPSVLAGFRANEYISVFFGPAFGLLINSREEDNLGELADASKTDYNLLDLSLVAGVKYHLGKRMGVSVRLDQSILPITDSGLENNNVQGVRQYSTVLGVNIAYVLLSKD